MSKKSLVQMLVMRKSRGWKCKRVNDRKKCIKEYTSISGNVSKSFYVIQVDHEKSPKTKVLKEKEEGL